MNSRSSRSHPSRATAPSQAQLEVVALAASQPAAELPPELELGAVALVVDQAGCIVVAEPICTALFQWEAAELVGQPLEMLLIAGTDKIRQYLAPEPEGSGSAAVNPPRLFALAQRRDGTSFPVAVLLELRPPNAGCWWAVAFHNVDAPSVSESVEHGSLPPTAAPRRGRAQVAGSPGLEGIPDIFHRALAEPAAVPEPPTSAPAPEPPVLTSNRMELSPEPAAPTAASAPAAPGDSEARLRELEQRLGQSNADLKRTRGHLQQQDEQLHAASIAAQEAAVALEEQTARYAQLEAHLTQALQAGDDLNNRLAAELQARAETEARLQELEQRLAQTAEDLKRAQAQPPPPPPPVPVALPAEPDPALQEELLELEARLRSAVTSLARTTAELESERGERRRCEQRTATLSARMQQLHEELKNQLATEQFEHQRLAQLEQQLHEQTQQNDLSVAKLQSSLQLEQCERKRLEAELVRARSQSSGSVRSSRAQVNSLRRQLHPPVESLHDSARRLLQHQLSDEQKQLAQSMLEHTLLLRTSLQESPEP